MFADRLWPAAREPQLSRRQQRLRRQPAAAAGRPSRSVEGRPGARLPAARRARRGPPAMSTGSQPRRFPIRRQSHWPWSSLAAIVVLIVVLTGDDEAPKVEDDDPGRAAPSAVAVGLGGVWVLNADGGTLVKVDPDSKKIDGRPVPGRRVAAVRRAGRGIGLGHRRPAAAALVRVDPQHAPGPEDDHRRARADRHRGRRGRACGWRTPDGHRHPVDPRTNRKVGRPIKVGIGPQGVSLPAGRRLGRELPRQDGLAHRSGHQPGRGDDSRRQRAGATSLSARAGSGSSTSTIAPLVKVDPAQNRVVGRPVPLGGDSVGPGRRRGLGVGREHRGRRPSSASTRTSMGSTATR